MPIECEMWHVISHLYEVFHSSNVWCGDVRWLDGGKDDGYIERELEPSKEELPAFVDEPLSDDIGQTSAIL